MSTRSAAASALTVRGPKEGGQSRKTNEYCPTLEASAWGRYVSPSPWPVSSTLAPATSGLAGIRGGFGERRVRGNGVEIGKAGRLRQLGQRRAVEEVVRGHPVPALPKTRGRIRL